MNGQCNRMNGASGLMDSWDILYRMLEHTARALRRLASSRSRSCLGKGKIAGVPGRFRLFVSLALSVLVHGLVLGISGHGLGAAFSSVASGMAPQALHAVLAGKPAELGGEGNSPRPNTTEPASILPQKPKVGTAENASAANRPTQPVSASTRAGTASRDAGAIGLLPADFAQPFEPRYPLQAAVADVGGSVTARFRISRNGEPEDIEILDSSPGGFGAAVVEALARTRIRSQSVRPDHWVIVSVIFDLAGTRIQSDFQQRK